MYSIDQLLQVFDALDGSYWDDALSREIRDIDARTDRRFRMERGRAPFARAAHIA